jgi:hypothetical protein
MATRTEISNLAISHLAIGIPIGAWDSDASVEAQALRMFYPIVRDQMLAAIEWPFAKKQSTLALVEEDPNDLWEYSYRYPADCLRFIRIVSGSRIDTTESVIPWARVGERIYCDESGAECEYIYRVASESLFSADFVTAFALRLAIAIAPRVIGGDSQALLKRLFQQYSMEMAIAQQNAANEAGYDVTPEAEYTRVRQ